MTVRTEVIRKWHELNKLHNSLNEELNRLFGGPDVTVEEGGDLVIRRNTVAAEKRGLERGMTDEEFESIYGDKS